MPLPAARVAVTVFVRLPPLSMVRLGEDKVARLKTERVNVVVRVMSPPSAVTLIV